MLVLGPWNILATCFLQISPLLLLDKKRVGGQYHKLWFADVFYFICWFSFWIGMQSMCICVGYSAIQFQYLYTRCDPGLFLFSGGLEKVPSSSVVLFWGTLGSDLWSVESQRVDEKPLKAVGHRGGRALAVGESWALSVGEAEREQVDWHKHKIGFTCAIRGKAEGLILVFLGWATWWYWGTSPHRSSVSQEFLSPTTIASLLSLGFI